MRHAFIAMALIATSACHDTASDAPVSCKADPDCPFQQCCVSGTCIDPGLIGTCDDFAGLHGTITFDKDSATAGIDAVTVTASIRDAFNRPLVGQSVSITVSSSCMISCDSLSPASGATDASGRFVSSLTSTIAGAKTVTLAIATATLATSQITFNAGEGVVPLGFADSRFDTTLGESLGSGRIGIIDATGDFATTPAASPVPVTVQLVPKGVSIPLVNSTGTPLTTNQLTIDVQNGPVALGSFYVPVAGQGFTLAATAGTQMPITSKTFTVAVNSITALDASPTNPGVNDTVTFAWSTAADGPSALRDSAGLVATTSPANADVPQAMTFAASITDHRSNSVRTIAIDNVQSAGINGTGDIRLRYVAASTGFTVAGDYKGTMSVGQTALPSQPDSKTGYTSLVANFAEGSFASVWQVFLSADDSAIKAVTNDETHVYALAEYTGSSAQWLDTASACNVPGVGAGFTGVTIAAIDMSTGHLAWCMALSPDSGIATSVTAGGFAYLGSTLYVAVNSGPMLSYSNGASPSSLVVGQANVPHKMVLIPLFDGGTFNSNNLVVADYPYMVSAVIADAATGELLIAGSATANNVPVVSTGTPTPLTTIGQDALVISLLSGQTLQWMWQSSGPGDETATSVGINTSGDAAVTGTFSKTITLGSTLTNANTDTAAYGYVAVINGQTHDPIWGAALASTSTIDRLSVIADDNQLIVSVDNEAPLTADGSIIGMSGAGSMAIAWQWSGLLLDVVPMPGCSGAYVTPTNSGGSKVLVNVPSGGTVNPFDISGNVLQASGPTALIFDIAPYDFRMIEVQAPD